MKSRFPAEKYALKGEERRRKMGSNGQTFRSIRFSPQNRARSVHFEKIDFWHNSHFPNFLTEKFYFVTKIFNFLKVFWPPNRFFQNLEFQKKMNFRFVSSKKCIFHHELWVYDQLLSQGYFFLSFLFFMNGLEFWFTKLKNFVRKVFFTKFSKNKRSHKKGWEGGRQKFYIFFC